MSEIPARSALSRKAQRGLWLAIALVAATGSGCIDALAPTPESSLVRVMSAADVIKIEGSTVTDRKFSVTLQVTNTGDRALYFFPDCRTLEKAEEGRWYNVEGNCADISNAIRIESGGVFELTLAHRPTPDFPDLAGKYRARFFFYFDESLNMKLPDNAGYSRPFRVE